MVILGRLVLYLYLYFCTVDLFRFLGLCKNATVLVLLYYLDVCTVSGQLALLH